MKSIKKRILSLAVLAGLCLVIFTGCGKAEDGKISTNPSENHSNSMGSDIKEGVSHAASDAGDLITDAGNDIKEGITKAGDVVKGAANDVSEGASKAAQDVRDAVR